MAWNLKKQEPKESEIQNAVCEYLQARGHFFWRQNNAGIQRTGTDGRQFWTTNKHSMRGVADIICFDKTGTGIAIFIECKRPSGKMSDDQENFRKKCEERGCEYYIVKSVDDLIQNGL
jgi:hypothetical protein